MVAVGTSAACASVIRSGHRAAAGRPFIAAYVDVGRSLSGEEMRQLAGNMELARSLGADVISTAGADLVETLLRVAREERVRCLVLGAPRSAPLWQRVMRRDLLGRLSRCCGDMEICLVPQQPLRPARRLWQALEVGRGTEWLVTVAILAGVTLTGASLERILGYQCVPLIYLLSIVVSPLFLSRWPVMALALGGALTWWFFYLPKQFSLRIHRAEDGMMLGVFLVTAIVSGHLTSRLRARERGGVEGERTARTLYDLLRGLNESRDLDGGGLAKAISKVEQVFQARVVLLRPGGDDASLAPQFAPAFALSGADAQAAQWAWQHRQWAGRNTANFGHVESAFVPLLSSDRVWGVLAVRTAQGESWNALQHELMESVARLLADMLQREETARQVRSAQLILESQKMQRALVDNFSHELQTPLSVLSSALQHLRQQEDSAPNPDVMREASIAASRLSFVVSEMVDLAQVDGGMLRPTLEWADVADFLQEWLETRRDSAPPSRVRLQLPDEPAYIRLDDRLLTTCLSNVLDNALRHAPEGTLVEVRALADGGQVKIRISDSGPGIGKGAESHIFERFYRGHGESPGGLGLGLAVAKEFIELMGGTISAGERPGGGACFTLTLPCAMQLPEAKAT